MMSWGSYPWMGAWMMGIGVAIFLITSILFARYVYRDASKRHLTNADVWAIVTFFLNLGGLILYLLLRGGYTVPSATKETARYGTNVKQEHVEPSPNALLETKVESMKKATAFCPMCGNERAPGANYCTKCGAALN